MTEPPPRGRGRPPGTGNVDPDAIVAVALDALADGGYRALTMRGVARTLGVSLSSVQHHFPTKDDLWRAAVDRVRTDAMERRRHADVLDLTASITALLEGQGSRSRLLASMLTDNDEGSAERIAYVAETFQALLARPTHELQQLEQMGHTRRFDSDAFFALMTVGIGSIGAAAEALEAIYGFDISTDQGRTELAAELADILALGIRAR